VLSESARREVGKKVKVKERGGWDAHLEGYYHSSGNTRHCLVVEHGVVRRENEKKINNACKAGRSEAEVRSVPSDEVAPS
jgi:hypothetical protein